MARSARIPLRPEGFTTRLTQPEQACLTWYVLSGCARKEAFLTFARPDMLDSKAKAAIDDYVKQFFARRECLEYIDAYEKALEAFLHPAPVKRTDGQSLEERKVAARTKLVEFAMSLANDIESASDPELVLKLADKAGLLDTEEEVEEQPRRYLPETCSGCAYRKFVEENCEEVPDGTELEGEE